MAESTSQTRLDQLMPDWKAQLQLWAQNGSLVAAAQEALVLSGTPSAIEALVGQWSAGDFSGLPPIVLLSAADISGAMGAYAISTGTIYLNADWLAGASKDQVNAVLTEELGHHLDGLLNAVDTAGDEGEYFAKLLIIGQLSEPEVQRLRAENDQIAISVSDQQVLAQAAMAPVMRGNSLYTVVNGQTWTQAQANAVAEGGNLTAITNAQENEFIAEQLQPKYSYCNTLWIGYTDSRIEGVWEWTTGETSTYTNWYAGEPGNSLTSAEGEDFGDIVLQANPNGSVGPVYVGQWGDQNDEGVGTFISDKFGIAEIPLSLTITRTGTVQEGAPPFTTSINLSAGTQVSGNLAEGATVYWSITGITADDLASGSLTGSGAITNGKLDIQHSLKADADTGEQLSVSVYSDAARTQQIGTTSSVAVQEVGPVLRANSLYTPVHGPSWTEAEANSVALGGHLATINNSSENSFITSAYASPPLTQADINAWTPGGTTNIQLWIGYTDAGSEGAWKWISGEQSTFTNWGPGEPDENITAIIPGGEDYATFLLYQNDFRSPGQWADICDVAVGSGIAEIPITSSITRIGTVKEGAAPFTTSIHLSAGTQTSGNLAEGAVVYWSITGISADDLASGSLTGSGTIANGKLDILHSLKADADTGEQFSVSVYSDAARTQQIGTTSSTGVVESEPQPTPANPEDDQFYTLDYSVDDYRVATTERANLTVLGADKRKSWALWGDDHKNRLVGGSREDFLVGGGDTDYLTGGLGPDTFVMTDWEQRKFDFITDFSAKEDVIGISKFMMDVSSDDSVEVVRYRDIKDQQTATETFDDAQADVYVFLGSTKQIQALKDKDWTQGLQLVIDSRRKVITYDSDGNWTTGAQTLAQFTGRFSTAWTGDNFLFGLDVPL